MKILALEIEIQPARPADFQPHLWNEAAEVYQLYLSGFLREFYFNASNHTAVLMLECSGVEEAQEILSSLPLVKAGLITFDLIPLAPYTGFSRLFHPREPGDQL